MTLIIPKVSSVLISRVIRRIARGYCISPKLELITVRLAVPPRRLGIKDVPVWLDWHAPVSHKGGCRLATQEINPLAAEPVDMLDELEQQLIDGVAASQCVPRGLIPMAVGPLAPAGGVSLGGAVEDVSGIGSTIQHPHAICGTLKRGAPPPRNESAVRDIDGGDTETLSVGAVCVVRTTGEVDVEDGEWLAGGSHEGLVHSCCACP